LPFNLGFQPQCRNTKIDPVLPLSAINTGCRTSSSSY